MTAVATNSLGLPILTGDYVSPIGDYGWSYLSMYDRAMSAFDDPAQQRHFKISALNVTETWYEMPGAVLNQDRLRASHFAVDRILRGWLQIGEKPILAEPIFDTNGVSLSFEDRMQEGRLYFVKDVRAALTPEISDILENYRPWIEYSVLKDDGSLSARFYWTKDINEDLAELASALQSFQSVNDREPAGHTSQGDPILLLQTPEEVVGILFVNLMRSGAWSGRLAELMEAVRGNVAALDAMLPTRDAKDQWAAMLATVGMDTLPRALSEANARLLVIMTLALSATVGGANLQNILTEGGTGALAGRHLGSLLSNIWGGVTGAWSSATGVVKSGINFVGDVAGDVIGFIYDPVEQAARRVSRTARDVRREMSRSWRKVRWEAARGLETSGAAFAQIVAKLEILDAELARLARRYPSLAPILTPLAGTIRWSVAVWVMNFPVLGPLFALQAISPRFTPGLADFVRTGNYKNLDEKYLLMLGADFLTTFGDAVEMTLLVLSAGAGSSVVLSTGFKFLRPVLGSVATLAEVAIMNIDTKRAAEGCARAFESPGGLPPMERPTLVFILPIQTEGIRELAPDIDIALDEVEIDTLWDTDGFESVATAKCRPAVKGRVAQDIRLWVSKDDEAAALPIVQEVLAAHGINADLNGKGYVAGDKGAVPWLVFGGLAMTAGAAFFFLR